MNARFQQGPLADLNSAIYEGYVRHRRYSPKVNAFTYHVCMMYLDLDELEQVFEIHPLFSKKPYRPVQFRTQDYLAGAEDLKASVLDCVDKELGFRPNGAVRLLTNLRYFGYIINPISVYYCFDQTEKLSAIVAEVTNTPWTKRIAYVLPVDVEAKKQRIRFNKQLHVSPFMEMDMHYQWFSNTPSNQLTIHLQNIQHGEKVFDATLSMKRKTLSRHALSNNLISFPWMTAKVVAAIYWQALKLFVKRVPVQPYPKVPSPPTATAIPHGAESDY